MEGRRRRSTSLLKSNPQIKEQHKDSSQSNREKSVDANIDIFANEADEQNDPSKEDSQFFQNKRKRSKKKASKSSRKNVSIQKVKIQNTDSLTNEQNNPKTQRHCDTLSQTLKNLKHQYIHEVQRYQEQQQLKQSPIIQSISVFVKHQHEDYQSKLQESDESLDQKQFNFKIQQQKQSRLSIVNTQIKQQHILIQKQEKIKKRVNSKSKKQLLAQKKQKHKLCKLEEANQLSDQKDQKKQNQLSFGDIFSRTMPKQFFKKKKRTEGNEQTKEKSSKKIKQLGSNYHVVDYGVRKVAGQDENGIEQQKQELVYAFEQKYFQTGDDQYNPQKIYLSGAQVTQGNQELFMELVKFYQTRWEVVRQFPFFQ